jgi:hypothetical protein
LGIGFGAVGEVLEEFVELGLGFGVGLGQDLEHELLPEVGAVEEGEEEADEGEVQGVGFAPAGLAGGRLGRVGLVFGSGFRAGHGLISFLAWVGS